MLTIIMYQNLVLSNFCKKHRFKKTSEMRNIKRGPNKNLLKNPIEIINFLELKLLYIKTTFEIFSQLKVSL